MTLTAGQRIIAMGSAALGLGSGGPQIFDLSIGYQPSGGGAITEATNGDYLTVEATTTRIATPVTANFVPGAGTWNIGVILRNNGGALPLSDSDWMQMTYVVVNP